MNWLDIVIIVLIAIPTLVGLKMGIIKALLTLAGVVVGIVLAGHFSAALAEKLTFIPQSNLAKIAAFAIIFAVVMLATTAVSRMVGWLVSAVMLGWLNHLGGAAFGFLLGILFCGALLAVWARFIGTEGPIAGSALARLLLDRFPLILALLPGDFGQIRSLFQR